MVIQIKADNSDEGISLKNLNTDLDLIIKIKMFQSNGIIILKEHRNNYLDLFIQIKAENSHESISMTKSKYLLGSDHTN